MLSFCPRRINHNGSAGAGVGFACGVGLCKPTSSLIFFINVISGVSFGEPFPFAGPQTHRWDVGVIHQWLCYFVIQQARPQAGPDRSIHSLLPTWMCRGSSPRVGHRLPWACPAGRCHSHCPAKASFICPGPQAPVGWEGLGDLGKAGNSFLKDKI